MDNNFLIPGTPFYLSEFLPPEAFNNPDIEPFWYINWKLVYLAYQIKLRFQRTMIINNWAAGGEYFNRGVRFPLSKTGNSLDPHHFLLAFDFDLVGLDADSIRTDIIQNYKIFYAPLGLTRIELNIAWVHVDMFYFLDFSNLPFTFSK